jgi:2-polyprenyl-3-methyl-5-hydroxy-6-metoxy-1,4-benzoquinol methylase
MALAGGDELGQVLDEQAAYYQALGGSYLEKGLDLPGGDELAEALEAFRPTGRVLELACGPGVWTGQLLRHAAEVTAVDASPEMLTVAAARVGSDRVRFVRADLFDWVPDRRYDVVFFGFWLSHVPPERFDSFWSLVADSLAGVAGSSSPTTRTAPPMSSCTARRHRPPAAGSRTAHPASS